MPNKAHNMNRFLLRLTGSFRVKSSSTIEKDIIELLLTHFQEELLSVKSASLPFYLKFSKSVSD
jgi:hypothetical protein